MPKRKAKKVSLEPILQDCNITSASNIDFSGATYPSDESFENRFGNRDISYCDLNKSPYCSNKLQNDVNREAVESLQVGFKVPFSSNNIIKCRPSLFDSIVNESEHATPESDAKSERLKRRCLQKAGNSTYRSSKQLNDENCVESPLAGFKVPFGSKNMKKCRPSLFDSVVIDSEPATPENDVKSERFKRKCFKKSDITFSLSSTNSSIVEAKNSPHCRKSTIVNYKGKNVAAHISKIFESDLESSDTTHNISNLNDPNKKENGNRCDNISQRKRKRISNGLSQFLITRKISSMGDIDNHTFDSIFSESIESNFGLQTPISKGAEMLSNIQKSNQDEFSNNLSNKLPIPFARSKKTQDHFNGVFDSDLDESNISAQSTKPVRKSKSVFHNDSSNTMSKKNTVKVNSNTFESDLDSSGMSIHCSRLTEDMDSITDNSSNLSVKKSSVEPLLVETETNFPTHSDAFESALEASNTSVQSISRDVEHQSDNLNKSSKILLNNTKKTDFLDSNKLLSNASDVSAVNDCTYTIYNHKPTKLDDIHGSENCVESKGQDSTDELNSIDQNSRVEAQKICEEGAAEINLLTEHSGTYVNKKNSANPSVQKPSGGALEQEFDIANGENQGNDILLNNNENSRADYIRGSNLPTEYFESFSEKDPTINLYLESSRPSNEFSGSQTSALVSHPILTDEVNRKDENIRLQPASEEKSINNEESNYPSPIRSSKRKSSLAKQVGRFSVTKRVSFKTDGLNFQVGEQSCSLEPLSYESSSEILNHESVFLDIHASSSRNTGSSACSYSENIQTSKILNIDKNVSKENSKIYKRSGDCQNKGGTGRSVVNSGIDSDVEENSENKNGEQGHMYRIECRYDEDSGNYQDSAAQNDDENIENGTEEYGSIYLSKGQSSAIGYAVNSNIGNEDQEYCENNTEEESEMDNNSQLDEESDEPSTEHEDGRNTILSEVDSEISNQHANHSSMSHSERNVLINSDSENDENYIECSDQEFHSNNNMMPVKESVGRSLKGRKYLSQRQHSNRDDSSKYKEKTYTQDPGKSSPAKNNVFDEYGSYLKTINDDANLVPQTPRQCDTFVFKRPNPKKLSKKSTKNILKNVPFSELKSRKRYASERNREQTLHNEIEESLKNRKCKEPTSAKINNAKLKKPKKWVSSHMYEFLINKLKPKFGVNSRVEAEKLVLYLAKQVDKVLKIKDLSSYAVVEEMKSKLAGLRVIETHFDFREFVINHFDGPFIHKVYPFSGVLCNPYEPKNMFEAIFMQD